MAPPGIDYVAALLGIWLAGGVAVPLALSYPGPELRYAISTVGAGVVLVHGDCPQLVEVAEEMGLRWYRLASGIGDMDLRLPELAEEDGAMILFTSGTTSRPKGVVLSHGNLAAQMRMLAGAWAWTQEDRILHVLPLHHVHGIVNVLLCTLWAGATCVFLPKFDAGRCWGLFVEARLTLFMAVPTVYAKLIQYYEERTLAEQERLTEVVGRLRLMVSGSAALPVSVLEKWEAISGHRLLERYGMTEIGMALSNPLEGYRKPGSVGMPLPRVEVRLVDGEMMDVGEGEPGEILVKGPAVFKGYWERPEATAAAFHGDWFRTGDVAVVEDGYYRILGRASVDILKSGGYKLSALEIEELYREHPQVVDCAVVGLPDAEWGELVAMAVVAGEPRPSEGELMDWARARIAHYKLPRRVLFLEALPRNAMGKVSKPDLKKLFL